MDNIGKFNSDREYLEAVKTLINCTQETNHRVNFFKEKILPSVHGGNILDIGIGNGELSKNLYNSFDLIHLVDPSLRALDSIDSKEFLGKDIQKFNTRIEDFNFSHDFYDLIVNSHTLYHLKRDDWQPIIIQSFAALKPKGTMLIVINNGLGRSKLTNVLGASNIIDIERLIEECVSIHNAFINIVPIYEQCETYILEEALKIIGVFLQDINFKVSKHCIIDYLDKNCSTEGKYKIDYCQYYFIIRKDLINKCIN